MKNTLAKMNFKKLTKNQVKKILIAKFNKANKHKLENKFV